MKEITDYIRFLNMPINEIMVSVTYSEMLKEEFKQKTKE